MTTAQDYKNLIAQVGVENLTATQKNFHNFLIEDINDGDFDDLMKEKDYSQKVNDYIASLESINNKSAPKKEQAEKEDNRPERILNYKGLEVEIRPFSKKSKMFIVWAVKADLKFSNEKFSSIKDAKSFIDENEMILVHNATPKKAKFAEGDYLCWWDNDGTAVKEQIKNVYFGKEEYIYDTSHKTGNMSYSESEIEKGIKEGNFAINKMPKVPVSNMPPEFLHIKRYIKLHGVTTKKADLLKMIRSLQSAIAKKIIGKDSPYAGTMMEIQNNLVQAYNSMGSSIKIEIVPEKIEKLQKIVGSEAIDKSVALIKRFITWLNKQDKNAASKLVVEIEKQLENSGKYKKELDFIKTSLNNYIDGKEVTIPEYELRGLAGIAGINGLGGFVTNLAASTAGFVLGRKIISYIDKKSNEPKSEVINSKDIVTKEFETLPFTGKWKELIGIPSANFKALIYGPPKEGKSTIAIDLANYLAKNIGKVLYVAAEEGISHTLQDKIKRLAAVNDNLFFSATIPADFSKFDYIFIDSIQRAKINYDGMLQLISDNPNKALIFISQVTKNGKHRGSNEYLHEVDVIIEVANGVATGYGRFSQGGTISIDFGN